MVLGWMPVYHRPVLCRGGRGTVPTGTDTHVTDCASTHLHPGFRFVTGTMSKRGQQQGSVTTQAKITTFQWDKGTAWL